MRKVANYLMRYSLIEFIARNLYYKFDYLKNRLNLQSPRVKNISQVKLSKLLELIASRSIGENALIIHSASSCIDSDNGIKGIVDGLLDLADKTGLTICMPSIPIHNKRKAYENSGGEYVYEFDVSTAKAWTGAIPNNFLKRQKVKRSYMPLNNMCAYGRLSDNIIKNSTIIDKISYPCGSESPWEACYHLDALICFIGVDVAHSLTMIHLVEDLWPDEWPIDNWYRPRSFLVKDGHQRYNIKMQERDPKWAMHYTEQTLNSDLIKNNIVSTCKFDGVDVSFIKTKKLIDYLKSHRPGTYPYYLLSKRYR